jgi:hypothetical protein
MLKQMSVARSCNELYLILVWILFAESLSYSFFRTCNLFKLE